MPSFNAITPEQLLRLIGAPDAPELIDFRIDEDVAADPYVIPASRRRSYASLHTAPAGQRGARVVAICQKGLKLSQGAAAFLRAEGVEATYLEGGTEAWRAQQFPRVPLAAIPANGPDGRSLWVTRHRPKIDRIACPWLIRRFIDPGARFLFVAPAEVAAVAERFGAIPFDVEGVRWSHDGALCTFDVMLDAWGLRTEALDRLALVVRAADTNRHDLAPQAAGLLAISVGLSRLHKDDLAQLEAGAAVYDALYRWARDGHAEGHDWPAQH